MKKRFYKLLAAVVSAITLLSVPAMAQDDIKVFVDRAQITFDVPPQLIGGRTMVPLRAIFEAIGAEVSWDGPTKTVTAYNEAYQVKATIGDNTMYVNGNPRQMDIAPMVVNDRTLVPARFVAEAFNCDVNWDGNTKTVFITTKEVDYSQLEQDSWQSDNAQAAETPAGNPGQVSFNDYSFHPTRVISVECTNIIKGPEANTIIHSENRFNDTPSADQEWLIMEFNVDYISSSDGENDMLEASDIIYKDTFYTETKSSIPTYDLATLGDRYGAYGVFDVEMYPGSSAKIVIGLLIDKYDGGILLKIPNKNGNDISWINCTDGVTSGGSDSSYSDNSYTAPVVSSTYYPGTSAPTYTSISGVPLKAQEPLSNGATVYRYNYSFSDDTTEYWDALTSAGWKFLKGNDDTTEDVFETSFSKDGKILIINIYWDMMEVWVAV